MNCIVCNGSNFSIRLSDFNKPPEERYSKYGDCCSMICALRKTDMKFQKNPEKFEQVILKCESGEEYIVTVPKKDQEETFDHEPYESIISSEL